MNIQKIKDFLKEKKLYVKTTASNGNIICICPVCGDHPNPKKKGHLYIATDKNTCHCFFCDYAVPTTVFIEKLSGTKSFINEVFTKEEREEQKKSGGITKAKIRKLEEYSIPYIEPDSLPLKRAYLKKRCNFQIEPEKVPNIVFDMLYFFNSNQIPYEDPAELDFLNSNYIGFLTQHNTKLMCRSIGGGADHHIAHLQKDPMEMLDYYRIWNNPKGNIIVLGEGVFDILGEYVTDSLNIRDRVILYAAGMGFTFTSLLRSVCFDHQLFQIDVIILSDRDKSLKDYRKFVRRNECVLKTMNIYYNKGKKDFGVFPLNPVKGGDLKSVQATRENKKSYK